MQARTLNLAKEFFAAPRWPRTTSEWPKGADEFYDNHIAEDLRASRPILVDMEGVLSFTSLFYGEVYRLALADPEVPFGVKNRISSYLKFQPADDFSESLFTNARNVMSRKEKAWRDANGAAYASH